MNTRKLAMVTLATVVACAGAVSKADTPACMHCGATCGLSPICVCEPGTKKTPRVEYDVTCEPLCIPACSHQHWPFGDHAKRASCTSCCQEPCECESRVRFCKKIKKETVDEDVAIVERTVKYVCDCCTGRCRGGCCGTKPRPQPPAWWMNLTWWWQRNPAE
jgi:hypothetical protein